LTEYAKRHDFPFLCVRGGETPNRSQTGSVTEMELARGPVHFELDKGLRHDLLLWRQQAAVAAAVRDFRPDIIHVVSPGDVSEIGVYIAKKLKLPLAISWHTNIHEFAATRLAKTMAWAGTGLLKKMIPVCEAQVLNAVLAFYRLGDVLYAPNTELVDMLRERTGKPVFLMTRGIDTHFFTPARRTVNDGIPRLGYVGRITPEKSVRFLRELENGLHAEGLAPFRFLIVGDGSEREWLRDHLESADLPGVLRGEALAEAYANMDVFVFPSRTDTFGNVVLEAFASQVPAVVTDAGGPRFIVRDGTSGFVARSHREFIAQTACLLRDADLRRRMGRAAREQAAGESWDAVFEKVYEGYRVAIETKCRQIV
jgi:glycosyltransferase involved in cell wall biosynthesis